MKVFYSVMVGVLLLFMFHDGAANGVNLYGSGTSSAQPVYDAWVKSYLFTRDDVSITYSSVGTNPALAAYASGEADFISLDRAIPAAQAATYGDLAQFPLVGQALVMGYNVPELPNNTHLVLDRHALGLIYCGAIRYWDDAAIKAPNTAAVQALLPHQPILVGYSDNAGISVPAVFKGALSSFSQEFADALAAANGTFALMFPDNTTGQSAGSSGSARVTWTKNNLYSITFVNYYDAVNYSLPYAHMVNQAGTIVAPTTESVQSAMADYIIELAENNFAIDIFDGNGTDSWPIPYMSFFSMNRNVTTFDCTNILELLNFVAWVHTNDAASQVMIDLNFVPLDVTYRKKLIDLLATVRCNGAQAYTTNFLLGSGPSLPLYTSFAVARSSTTTKLKFYETTANAAKQQLITYDSDFGATNNGLSQSWVSQMRDAALLPVTVFAVVPGYNVPELQGLELVLDYETIAAIYLGNISMWDDDRIKALNSEEVVSNLPSKQILVVTQNISSTLTQLFVSVLRAQVPGFGDFVSSSTNPSFPVQSTNRSLVTTAANGVIPLLTANSYSFAFWQYYDIALTRTTQAAALSVNNKTVAASDDTVKNALEEYLASGSFDSLPFNALTSVTGESSWPISTFGSFIYRQSTMQDCSKAQALSSFLVWALNSTAAQQIAERQGFVLTSSSRALMKRFWNLQKNFTCEGVAVSSYYNCIIDGTVCSDAGLCLANECVCNAGKTGQYCETDISSSSSDSTVIFLAVIIPVVVGILCLLLVFIVGLIVCLKRKGNSNDDWEINYDELEVGEQLGAGGFGEVNKAVWKGTEVAVKVMASEKFTKEMEKNFKDEVRVMTALRHPNVVLFMAASTKAPKMCIVMEYMALGSLFDLLHNELIPDIPFALKAKMAYQGSKGMHFLHSSGIVHRDLKSLNLLLDSKWNVKVSDFGLTKFKEDMKKGGTKDIAGSVHWTAPEILNEVTDVDFILADVYSFGVILWELLTREQPYFGMSPAAVAVAVIRDGIRPKMPDAGSCPVEYEELIVNCWHSDPTIRPTFLEIMTRLSSMNGDTTGNSATYTSKTGSSSSGNSGPKPNIYGSWTMPSNTSGSTSGNSSNKSGSSNNSKNMSANQAAAAAGGIRAPEGEVTIVFTDITRAASLWEFNASAMRDATLQHNETLRTVLKKHRGYEVVFIRDRNSGEGSFCMAFQNTIDALSWCMEVQQELLQVEWPEALLDHPGAAEEWGDTDDRVLYKGLRVRMGVHVGTPRMVRDPMTRRVEYIGPAVNAAARITALTHGGQILMSHAAFLKVKDTDLARETNRMASLGKFEMPDAPQGSKLFELKARGLEGRFFGGVSKDIELPSNTTPSTGSGSDRATTPRGKGKKNADDDQIKDMSAVSATSSNGEVQQFVGEGMMFKEDNFLTSANLCRWIIDYNEIQVGKQIGLGSYGVVYRGKWKGVDVAVKRFIKQKLDERRMLEFRAEMAFLSELHHPNIVLFIGACMKKPNLCIVTEFAKQGSLKDILQDSAMKLVWQQKLKILRSAALGINYLHSLHPVIVHRDLKPSNLLVDENWNVKVADFGFARIKEENATMTRCGTPCWTAPEVIRGEKYDEKADVYSFGIIMWEVLTRRQPYAGRNFMGVSLDVLEGRRPQIPNDCPAHFTKIMKKCWHAKAEKRPLMEDVLAYFDKQVGGDDFGVTNP